MAKSEEMILSYMKDLKEEIKSMNEFLMDLDEKFVPRTEYQKESD
jgi:hypothetical protein